MMPWRKFLRLTWAERFLLIRTGFLIVAIRVALWVLPWHSVIGALRRPGGASRFAGFTVDRLTWAVRHASRPVPRATCLTQALVLHHLLFCAGHTSRVHIGVAKGPASSFHAHAWVECNGSALLNHRDEITRYARLLTIDTR